MADSFRDDEWAKIHRLMDARGDDFGLPARRDGSVVLGSFNIRKLGSLDTKSPGAWTMLTKICKRFDLLAIQEVQDTLDGLKHIKDQLGDAYGMVVSDITGGIAGKRGMVERLAYLFLWKRVERAGVASDITIDRSAVLDTLYEQRADFLAAFKDRVEKLEEWQAKVDAKLARWRDAVDAWAAQGGTGKKPPKPWKPKKPPFVLPHFLTFIRTPHCVAFRVKGGAGARPYEFLAINAHLLYGDGRRQKEEREMEFYGLIQWLVERARQAKRMYHKDMILLGDLNLDFKKVDARRDRIVAEIKALNGGDLKGRGRATVYFPFLDVHPSRKHIRPESAAIFRSTARRTQTYDQIAMFSHDERLPTPADKSQAGKTADGFDYGVFNFVDLFAEALHEAPFSRLHEDQRKELVKKFEHDLSDHLPIWIRLPNPR